MDEAQPFGQEFQRTLASATRGNSGNMLPQSGNRLKTIRMAGTKEKGGGGCLPKKRTATRIKVNLSSPVARFEYYKL